MGKDTTKRKSYLHPASQRELTFFLRLRSHSHSFDACSVAEDGEPGFKSNPFHRFRFPHTHRPLSIYPTLLFLSRPPPPDTPFPTSYAPWPPLCPPPPYQ